MPPRSRFFRWALLALAWVACYSADSAVAADQATRFEIDFFQHGASEPMNQATIWISNRRVRIEQHKPNAREKGPVLVYRGDNDLVLSISDREQQYSKIERGMLRLLGMKSTNIEMRENRRAVDGQLRGMPSDQRKALERVLGLSRADAATAPLTVEHAIDASTVAGIECRQVLISRGGRSVGDACVASWSNLGLAPSDIEVFRALANFQRDALRAHGVTPLEFVPEQTFDLVTQFDGFPLSFRRVVDGEERSAIKVRSIQHLPADESLFSPPSGYALRQGYSAFFAHLSALESGNADPGNSATSPANRAAQPAASPAPKARIRSSRRKLSPTGRRSITLLP